MLLLCSGLVFLAGGIYGFFGSRRLVRKGLRADAEVVDLHVRRDEEGGSLYYPVVRFRTADGQEVVAQTRVGGSPPHARPGDQVRVIYQPDRPQVVSLDTIIGRGVAAMCLCILVGLGITVYAAYRMAR